jgi:hypothetical protein
MRAVRLPSSLPFLTCATGPHCVPQIQQAAHAQHGVTLVHKGLNPPPASVASGASGDAAAAVHTDVELGKAEPKA